MDLAHFEHIRDRHGAHGSWALWAPQEGPPKSRMGDLSVLDPRENPGLLDLLRPQVVMCGLNLSRGFPDSPFRNFHDPSPVAQDYKLRHAFHGTPYWGAYMTDLIKGQVECASTTLLLTLRAHPEILDASITAFREELRDLGHPRPLILAFGGAVHSLVRRHVPREVYSTLVRLTHYSHYISMERYRERVREEVGKDRVDGIW